MGTSSGSGTFNPAYIIGADVSWTTQHEAAGYTYSDGTSVKPMENILSENGFNFVRLRTFVDPSASDGYSPGQHWCGKEDTTAMGKRAKRCGLGLFVDFHMSDTLESIGTNANPSGMAMAWRSLSTAVPATPVSAQTHLTNNLYQAAHDYVYDVMQGLVAAGAKPDMVQIGNETNTGMGGVSTAPSSRRSSTRASRRCGRRTRTSSCGLRTGARGPIPQAEATSTDGSTTTCPQRLPTCLASVDAICGSTYGTTNGGQDWTTSFSYVTSTYNVPVMSCEYTDSSVNANAGAAINKVMRALPNGLGRGAFAWEPADYPSPNATGTIFSVSGKVYTTNAAMKAYPTAAGSYGLPVPAGSCH